MLTLIGLAVVIICVIGGFTLAGGNLIVLMQPAEFIVIAGVALGSLLVSTPTKLMKQMIGSITGTVKGSKLTRETYMSLLRLLNALFHIARRDGIIALEPHVNDPKNSPVFQKYPFIYSYETAVSFLCDTIKLFLAGSVSPSDIEALMDAEIETHHDEKSAPPNILAKVGDALPGLGIVAAVLGIIITMGHMDAPAEQIGKHVAAALVGTFLGVLLCYGFVQPLSMNIENQNRIDGRLFHVIKAGVAAFAKGMAPALAVEFARRAIYHSDRPTFEEVENEMRKKD
ncbi:MAG: flagellar motor stator protein MotA [Calditrichaeota bacterium]|nr:flagellar motor stator protein MotA [Calditrichota bacterium]